MVSFLPIVVELVEPDYTTLMLLSHVVGNCGTAYTVWPNQYYVQFVFLLQSRGEFHFHSFLNELEEFAFQITFLAC
jgi:hypothetical protein